MGLGLAAASPAAITPDIESLNEDITSTAPEIDVLGATPPAAEEKPRSAPLIDVKQNPLGAIGAVMMNTARGARGQKLYTDELREQRAMTEQMELQKLNVGTDAMMKGLQLLKNTPADARQATVQQYGQLFEHVLPGFTAALEQAAQQPAATEAQIEALGEFAPILISMGGSVDEALKLAQKPQLMAQLRDTADMRNQPEITRAFKNIEKTMQSSDAGSQLLAQAAADGWTVSDLQDPQIQEALGLTQGHVNSIARNAEIQSALRPYGFIPTTDLDERAKQQINEKSLARISAEASAKKSASEQAEVVVYENPDTGDVTRAPVSEEAALRARGYRPVITGRTPDDAATREQLKQQGKDAAPINPYVSGKLGLDPNLSKADFREQGGNPVLEAKDVREMQALDEGLKNFADAADRAKNLVEQNPDLNAIGGSLASLFGNVRQHVASVGRIMGANVVDSMEEEFEKWTPVLKEQGIESAVLRSLVLDMSFMAAVSRGQKGQGLSDKDVKAFAQIVGSAQADPVQFARVLDSVVVRFDQAYRNRFETITNKRPPSGLADIAEAEKIAESIAAGGTVTKAQTDKLTPRAKNELRMMLSR